MATATITFDASDYGNDSAAKFDPRRDKVWVTNNALDGVVHDVSGNKQYVRAGYPELDENGAGSIVVPIPGAGFIPETWQTTIHFDLSDRSRPTGRRVLAFGPYTITGSGPLSGLVEEQDIPADYRVEILERLDALETLDAADVGADATGTAASLLATHAADTTAVHGIADTSALVLTGDTRLSDARTPLTHTHDDRYYTETEADALLAAKATTAALTSHAGDTANPHSVTKAQVGLASVDNTADSAKPVSTAQAAADAAVLASAATDATTKVATETTRATTAEALLAPKASPTFTGTVSGITAAMVGLGNVANTSDASKPVSTAQAAADTAIATAAATDATTKANAAQAAAVQRGNHTGSQIISTVTGLQTALDSKAGSASPTAGEVVPRRDRITGNTIAAVSGVVHLTYFTADKSETISTLTVSTGSVAAAATPTLCRLGLYSVDGSDNLTLVASTTNDTTLFAATQTAYAKALSTPYAKVAGQRYATAILVVSGATMPNFHGVQLPATGWINTLSRLAPATAGRLLAQTDLPASITAASMTGQQALFAMLLT
jgi:hypothetical protein